MSYRPSDIKALRERQGWSQAELAASLNVHRTNISRWESGATSPRGSAIRLLDQLAASAPPEPPQNAKASSDSHAKSIPRLSQGVVR
ncbi:helix-turn-helix domain-containing protein [Aureimonas ureilytica]|uniref:helix-turn-helix domain-containing protein n=1 Tax=Aureimonas ureilytica TaxID=401562 RepID=UPI00058FC83A